MSNVVDLTQGPGRKLGGMNVKPRDPDLVLEVIRLKDQERLSWRQIGERLELSHQAPYLLYKRWRHREWVKENNDDNARVRKTGT